jgi:serine/threonine protein phosphatase 1
MAATKLDDPEVTYVIGDIHGQLSKLARLLGRCSGHTSGRSFRIICLGDYIDRGPQSKEVIQFLMSAQVSYSKRLVCLRGNHEQMLLSAKTQSSDLRLWLANGEQTPWRAMAQSIHLYCPMTISIGW